MIPNVSASLGIGATLPLPRPFHVGITVASINADYKMPATFEFEPNRADLVIKNMIGASADLLETSWTDGWHFELAETTLSTTTIPFA
ncbi:MAG: hypothetical protein AB8B40_02250 [Prochlorococcus sp.]